MATTSKDTLLNIHYHYYYYYYYMSKSLEVFVPASQKEVRAIMVGCLDELPLITNILNTSMEAS